MSVNYGHIIRFFVILLFQVLVINSLNLGGYIYPAFYIYFILVLPFDTAGWVLLLSAFFMGLGVDYFSNSLGINAATAVFTAFCRPLLLQLLRTKRDYESNIKPGLRDFGLAWFLSYLFVLVFFHHSVLFFLEYFSLKGFFQTLLRIVLSSAVTVILVLLVQLIFHQPERK
jgi:rod shape-determining protein MreD